MSSVILDLLRRCVANDSIKKASPRHGGEWHSPCPKCGGKDRFIVFPEQAGKDLVQKNSISGTWSCPRHCGTGGDSIDFCTNFLGMNFTEACAELGIALEKQDAAARRKYREMRRLPTQQGASWTPAEYPLPSIKWIEQATKLADSAHKNLLNNIHILTYLSKRGLPVDAVRRYGLGYLEGEGQDGTCIYRQRSAFGLAVKEGRNGKPIRALRIPRGITIPFWNNSEPAEALRVRIRRRDVDIDRNNPRDPKFQLIPQEPTPFSAPMLLYPVGVSAELATWVVVEAELDAMLIHHACAGRVGVMSILTVSGKPDKHGHDALQKSARILVSIDFEQNAQGEYHTAKNWNWWKDQYTQAKLWPVPEGKDPGEAYSLGVDIARWIFLAMPEGASSCGGFATLGALQLGRSTFGGRAKNIQIPSYLQLEDIPRDVRILVKIWQGKPIGFKKNRDENGNAQGFEWVVNHDWRAKNYAKWHAFVRFQDKSRAVWDWLSDHVDMEIHSKNVLFVFGKE